MRECRRRNKQGGSQGFSGVSPSVRTASTPDQDKEESDHKISLNLESDFRAEEADQEERRGRGYRNASRSEWEARTTFLNRKRKREIEEVKCLAKRQSRCCGGTIRGEREFHYRTA